MPRRVLAYEQINPVIITTQTHNDHLQIETVRVDMAAMKVENRPVELLTSVGSCVAICLYDPVHRCGGLAHVMLPHSARGQEEPLPSKFADTAVPTLADGIRKISGTQSRLTAKIAGGANMFANTCSGNLNIGAKNVQATKNALVEHKIRLVGEDVGGIHGRRITFNVALGSTTVKIHNGELKKI